ncbi:hypothetical protein ACWDRB_67190 [Nonomuraea sp. NPDC003707]
MVELRERANAGDPYAASELGKLLAAGGQVEEALVLLRARAIQDPEAAMLMIDLLTHPERSGT